MEDRRDRGATMAELIDALPVDLMRRVGYFGRPEGVAAEFARLAAGLDIPVVRMITSAPGPAKVLLALEASEISDRSRVDVWAEARTAAQLRRGFAHR